MIATSTLEDLADSKVVIFDLMRAEIDVSFGLRMRHARRLVALVVAMFGWRLLRLPSRCTRFPCWGIVEVFYLSVVIITEWVELRETAVRGVPGILQ